MVATVLVYDYSLTLGDEASEPLAITLNCALTPYAGSIYVGKKKIME